jgi:uncharacterized membrane protein YtjA (UPF0391 family)
MKLASNYSKVLALYGLMLLTHFAHILEEAHGRFWLITNMHIGVFLTISWALFCIPLALFYLVMLDDRLALKISVIYALGMILQGVGHYVIPIIRGLSFNGFAGGYTGIAQIIIGSFLMYYLLKEIKTKKVHKR